MHKSSPSYLLRMPLYRLNHPGIRHRKGQTMLYAVSNLKAGDRKVLFVLPENSDNIFLSSRNLPEVSVLTVDEINTYAIMNANKMVIVDGVQDILASRIK